MTSEGRSVANLQNSSSNLDAVGQTSIAEELERVADGFELEFRVHYREARSHRPSPYLLHHPYPLKLAQHSFVRVLKVVIAVVAALVESH